MRFLRSAAIVAALLSLSVSAPAFAEGVPGFTASR